MKDIAAFGKMISVPDECANVAVCEEWCGIGGGKYAAAKRC